MTDIDKLIERLEAAADYYNLPDHDKTETVMWEASQALRGYELIRQGHVDEILELRAENEKLRAVYEAARRFINSDMNEHKIQAESDLYEALAAIDSPTEK